MESLSPHQGKSKEKSDTYHIQRNTSTLTTIVDVCKLQSELCNDELNLIQQLKVIHVNFNENYSNSPPPSVASTIHCKKNPTDINKKKQHQKSIPKKKRKHVSEEQDIPTCQVTASSCSITDAHIHFFDGGTYQSNSQ
jgi:hypothetical protein